MPYDLNFYVPLPPRRPVFRQEGYNAMMDLLKEDSLPESTFAGGRDYANPQGPPMPLGMAYMYGDRNAMRRALYPYLMDLGWAVGASQR